MATHSSILAWKIPWTEESGGLQPKVSQRVKHDWANKQAQGPINSDLVRKNLLGKVTNGWGKNVCPKDFVFWNRERSWTVYLSSFFPLTRSEKSFLPPLWMWSRESPPEKQHLSPLLKCKARRQVSSPPNFYDCCCSVTRLCPTLCDSMDCSTPGLPVPDHLLEFTQVHIHWIGDAI